MMKRAVLQALLILGVLILVGAKVWVAIGAAALMIVAHLVRQRRRLNP